MEREFKNTDFFIEDIDESVKDLAVNDTSVTHVPANTDFFIENIDNNVMEIAVDRGLTPDVVEVVPTNTDFFIVNIDSNVIKIATNLGITPTRVTKVPANTDFFIENIYYNLILICEELNIEPFEITRSPINTDFFIEAIAKNVEKIMDAQTEKHVNGSFINITLSADSEITDYELDGNATQNGTPTPDAPVAVNTVTGEQTVKVVGKNLADHDTTNTLNAYISGANLIRPSSPDRLIFYPVQQNTDYTVSLTRTPISGQPRDDVVIGFTETTPAVDVTVNSKTQVVNTNVVVTLNSGSNNFIVIKYCNSQRSDADATLATLQLEVGSQAGAYEPYTSQSQEINLGSIELAKIGTYQDRIYKDDGKWYIEKQVGKVVFDGSESGWYEYVLSSSGFTQYYRGLSEVAHSSSEIRAISDYFTGGVLDERYRTSNLVYTYATGIAFNPYTSDFADLAAFKTWLGTHPTTVYYALATPTTTEITDETLIEQLEAVYDFELKEGTVNIVLTATSPNLPAILKATIKAIE